MKTFRICDTCNAKSQEPKGCKAMPMAPRELIEWRRRLKKGRRKSEGSEGMSENLLFEDPPAAYRPSMNDDGKIN